jgi:predicted nucleotidyltransferase component of viral defense system
MTFLHENKRFKDVLNVVSLDMKITVPLVEKDYWIMHSLYGLQQLKFDFYLKGGTSLSKGFGTIDRFSEDLDIMIVPPEAMNVKYGKNHDKDIHRHSRRDYFDWILKEISIDGISEVVYDPSAVIDGKYRNADIVLKYDSVEEKPIKKLKQGILLEIGFDQVDPFTKKDVSSWAFDFAKNLGLEILDNRAFGVRCYNPEYTFVEKLSAISKKFRQYQENGMKERNFMRHYYDIFMLLKRTDVQKFLGSEKYLEHKTKKFGPKDVFDLSKNEAFILSDKSAFDFFNKEHKANSPLHYDRSFPSFNEIMAEIGKNLSKM